MNSLDHLKLRRTTIIRQGSQVAVLFTKEEVPRTLEAWTSTPSPHKIEIDVAVALVEEPPPKEVQP